jgi:iron only hydrogenase large subunit-like protein
VVAVNGLANAKAVLDDIEVGRCDYQIVEVMACPFGCINGGGQRIGSDEKNLKTRMKAIYDIDDEEMIKVAHKNPIISDIYEKFLSKPNSERNRQFLHTERIKAEEK